MGRTYPMCYCELICNSVVFLGRLVSHNNDYLIADLTVGYCGVYSNIYYVCQVCDILGVPLYIGNESIYFVTYLMIYLTASLPPFLFSLFHFTYNLIRNITPYHAVIYIGLRYLWTALVMPSTVTAIACIPRVYSLFCGARNIGSCKLHLIPNRSE